MPGVVEVPAVPAAPPFRRDFNVGQQKVELEIDFVNKSLK
jgi:hypothetical protein